METTIKYKPELTNVSETLLVPLFFKAKETLENGAIKDSAAVNIINGIEYNFDNMRTDIETQKLIAIRTSIIDDIVEKYISKTVNPVIINLQQAPFKWGNDSDSVLESWGYRMKNIKSFPYLKHDIAKNINFSMFSNAVSDTDGLKVNLMKTK